MNVKNIFFSGSAPETEAIHYLGHLLKRIRYRFQCGQEISPLLRWTAVQLADRFARKRAWNKPKPDTSLSHSLSGNYQSPNYYSVVIMQHQLRAITCTRRCRVTHELTHSPVHRGLNTRLGNNNNNKWTTTTTIIKCRLYSAISEASKPQRRWAESVRRNTNGAESY